MQTTGAFSLLLSISVLVSCSERPIIDFYKEHIKIEIADNQAHVNGTYYFKNLTEIAKRVRFYYPFPVDSVHRYPHMILLTHPYEKDLAGIKFTMVIKANSTDSFNILYWQKLNKSQFRYITTTTREWQRPIKDAEFTISVPDTLSIRINYAVSEEKMVNSRHCYFIRIKNFYPGEDLMIEW